MTTATSGPLIVAVSFITQLLAFVECEDVTCVAYMQASLHLKWAWDSRPRGFRGCPRSYRPPQSRTVLDGHGWSCLAKTQHECPVHTTQSGFVRHRLQTLSTVTSPADQKARESLASSRLINRGRRVAVLRPKLCALCARGRGLAPRLSPL